MKIQALIAAVALAVAGGAAFAQTSSASPSAAPAPTTTANEGKTGVASTQDATPDAVTHKGGKSMHKGHHVMRHHHAMRHHKHQNVSSADHDTMASMHHMGAGPKADLNAHDRQARMDRAYEDWKKNHG